MQVIKTGVSIESLSPKNNKNGSNGKMSQKNIVTYLPKLVPSRLSLKKLNNELNSISNRISMDMTNTMEEMTNQTLDRSMSNDRLNSKMYHEENPSTIIRMRGKKLELA